MHGSGYSINDSILELLTSLEGCTDQEIVLPVIESLLQELNLNDSSNVQAYRQLIVEIASALIDSETLSADSNRHFIWLKKLASSGHDISALQALVKNIKADRLSSASVQRAVSPPPAAEPTSPAITGTAGLNSEATNNVSPEKASLDFNQLITPYKEQPHQRDVVEAFDDNQYNDQKIRTLKETLQDRLDSTKSQCREFESLMELLLTDLNGANSQAELEMTRSTLKSSIQRLLSEHKTISGNIIDVTSELTRFETHCEQLNHELGLVKQLSMTDELTRLPNRRAFLKRLQNETGRVQRYGYPLSVAILDLDLFKEINDTYGHAVGDEVLKAYTEKVLSTFRNYDMVARYGGEEFAVLLPHTDIYGAERALQKVLQKSAETRLNTKHGDETLRLPSFSAGIAVYKEGESIDSVINRADKAMYSAKKLGRNRVVVEATDAV